MRDYDGGLADASLLVILVPVSVIPAKAGIQ